MKKLALILGIGGQDGSYLAEHLLEEGYIVHGMYRRSSTDNLVRIRHLLGRIILHQGDLADTGSVQTILRMSDPHEIYNLADQDDERWSFRTPSYNTDITGGAVVRLLEEIRNNCNPNTKLLQPISAKIFSTTHWPQDESTPLQPLSPYACAKASAYHVCRFYRSHYGMFVSTVILYNHDSPRRGPGYLLQTICRRAMDIIKGVEDKLYIGAPDTVVDVGYAGDYVKAMRLVVGAMLPDDYVIASGHAWTIKRWAMEALRQCGIQKHIEGLIKTDPDYQLPKMNGIFVGNATKAKKMLGWAPTTDPAELVKMIMGSLGAK